MNIKNVFYYLFLVFLISCTADSNIGTLDFESEEIQRFSIYIPETGTLEFKQVYSPTTKNGDISTFIKVIDLEERNDSIKIDLFAFKTEAIKFENLSFTYRGNISVNSDYLLIDNSSGNILNDNRVKISILKGPNSENISGHYEGIGKLLDFDENGNEASFELFNVCGNISFKNQLLLLIQDQTNDLDYIEGIYNYIPEEVSEFNGNAFKENLFVATATNDSLHISENFMTLKQEINLIFTSNNQEKKLELTLQKVEE